MRDNETGETTNKVQLHFRRKDGDETLKVSKNVREIYLAGKKIQSIDLTSLLSCSRLHTLNLQGNRLDSIDLVPLSSCTKLHTLYLEGNRFESLDLTPLSSCTGLQELDLSDNQLQRIDLTALSSCTKLQELRLSGNQLKSIDLSPISKCTGLQRLYLGSDQLQRIDLTPLSSCSGLKELIIVGPWFTGRGLLDFDLTPLSSCTKLQTLHLAFHQLRRIDLTPLSACTKLHTLGLANNKILWIDLTPLSSCTRLQTLHLQGNGLNSLDLSPLSSCARLQMLVFSKNRLRRIDLTPLSSCTGLQELNLSDNHFGHIDVTPLLSSGSLQTLDLGRDPPRTIRCSLEGETLQLVAPKLNRSGSRQTTRMEAGSFSRADLEVLTRVVDAMWHHSDRGARWRAHAVVQDILSQLNLAWLGLVDIDPPDLVAVLKGIGRGGEPTESIIGLVCRQIDTGRSALGLDIDRARVHAPLAATIPRVLQARQEEMSSVQVTRADDGWDLRALWLTAYGHSVLSAMHLGTRCNPEELGQVREALNRLGFSLNQTEGNSALSSNVSEPLREYIWKLADFRSKKK